jgi:catechol 2,3-dioxygenase-like lactoylglutathione lyase family enzyme
MTLSTPRIRPARRFVHVCYSSADHEPVVKFFVDAFGMQLKMTTTVQWSDGAVLGLDGQILSGAAFVYDRRGPRTSPALEIQTWVDPGLEGRPPTDPTAAGIHGLGVTVPILVETLSRLGSMGCTLIGRGSFAGIGGWATFRDPRGVMIDVVEGETVNGNPSQLRHLRISVTDLAESLHWFEGLGFATVARSSVVDASALGVHGDVRAEAVRLRLPDEPFEVLLVEWREPRTHGRHSDLANSAGLFRAALAVDDMIEAYDALGTAGWNFRRPPMAVPLVGTPVPDLVICFLNDPDGVAFEFVERPRGTFR